MSGSLARMQKACTYPVGSGNRARLAVTGSGGLLASPDTVGGDTSRKADTGSDESADEQLHEQQGAA